MNSNKPEYLIYFTLFHFLCCVNGFVWNGDTFRRKVSLEMNPGLTPPSVAPPGVSMLHTRALSHNDTLHFLFCSGGAPALLLIHTNSSESEVHVNWTKFLSTDPTGSVKVEPESSVQHRGALVFTNSVLSPYRLHEFEWDDVNKTVDYTHHTAQLCGRHASFSSNASLCLHFSAYDCSGREEAWPSLLHHANSSQLRVVLKGVMPRTNQSHFTLELQTVNEAGLLTQVDVHRSIDDEYTPSIFQVSEWVWPHDNSSSTVGFFQWKPVVYQKSLPAIEDATPCINSEPVTLPQAPPSRIIPAYFNQHHFTHGLNITFNVTSELTPNSTQYLSWTMLAGIGTPPSDFFSSLVIAIMAVGLGTPLILLAAGGVYICVWKRKRDTLGHYEPINQG
ncbi:hypothetical protein HF521_001859 [Silurus meridionalis]|uniref:Glycosylated lysosomal membrane protein n=1 Tax=Silurus meridionalis TaxID=175797 RepID=A0A8T0B7B8_SILME|nr:hypothetical protein HF521_001859 [Silurus meridionalis]